MCQAAVQMVPSALNLPLSSERRSAVAPAPSPDVASFERAMVEFFVEAADMLGLPKSVAAIYAVIFASPRPLSFAEIETRLHLSKGSVSQGLRFLRQIGAIRAAEGSEKPEIGHGELKAYSLKPTAADARAAVAAYEPDMELRRLVARLLKERIEPQLSGSDRKLAQLVATVPFADRDESRLVSARLKQLQSWHRKARKLVPFAKTVLALG